MARSSLGFLLATLMSLGALFLGCSLQIGEHHPRFIIAFLDETGSRKEMWTPMLDQIAEIARGLKHQDEFAVLAINDKGFSESNVLVQAQTIFQVADDVGGYKLKAACDGIAKQVLALKPITPAPQVTDIVGSIRQAADMSNKEDKKRQIVLAFFSDMQQTPKMPADSDLEGVKFPDGTKGYCFYVTESKRYDYDATVTLWQHVLPSAGINIAPQDFNSLGRVAVSLKQAFPD
jgi:hypothetical protein